jgi:hypothetical protein
VGYVPIKRLITVGNFLDKINSKRFNGLSYSAEIENFDEIMKDKKFLVGHALL